MAKLTTTFKVHRVEPRGLVDGKTTEERVLLHPLDPHETGKHDLAQVPRSGHGQIKLVIDAPDALGKFKVGAFVTVTFEV